MRKWDFVTQTHNKQRVSGGKTCNNGYANVRKTSKGIYRMFFLLLLKCYSISKVIKSVGKDAQGLNITAFAVDICIYILDYHKNKKRRNEGFN